MGVVKCAPLPGHSDYALGTREARDVKMKTFKDGLEGDL